MNGRKIATDTILGIMMFLFTFLLTGYLAFQRTALTITNDLFYVVFFTILAFGTLYTFLVLIIHAVTKFRGDTKTILETSFFIIDSMSPLRIAKNVFARIGGIFFLFILISYLESCTFLDRLFDDLFCQL